MTANRPIENSKEWWEAFYASSSSSLRYSKEPSSFLFENVELLRSGKVLDLGMGEGGNAAYLASKGFEVTGIDFCDVAIGRSRKLAQDMNVSVQAECKDLDMYLIPLMAYDNVVIVNYKPADRLLKDINRGLKQGGMICMDAYTVSQLRDSNTKVKPEMFECFGANEVLRLLKNVHVVKYQEYEVAPGHHKVQCLARKTSLVG